MNNEESKDYRNEIRILNQLMAAQTMFHVFPDQEKLSEFACGALKNLPGVELCSICFASGNKVIGDTSKIAKKLSESMSTLSSNDEKSNIHLPFDENLIIFRLQTLGYFFGYILVKTKDESNFDIFQPAASNFVNFLSLHFEMERQKKLKHNEQDHLEEEVKNRTADLLAQINERRLAEERYQDLYENAPDMYISIDPKSAKILQCNNTLTSLTGFTKEEIIGKTFFELYHPDSLVAAQREFEKFRNTGSVFNAELVIRKKDGESLDVLLNVSAIRDTKGKILYSRSSLRDISQRKLAIKAEIEAESETARLLEVAEKSRRALLSVVEDQKRAKDEIQKLNLTLEQRVIERTAQLEVANKELEAFSYSVSHDLRAPLRHISGFISLFLENKTSALTDDEMAYLNTVSNSANEMGKLIDALLVFSRLSRTELQKTQIDTRLLVRQGLQLFENDIKARNIKVETGELVETYSDLQLIRQVWTNLISNAVKYTGKTEKPVIEIGSYLENDFAVFFVKDNGAGFDMKYSDKLFGVFQRLHKPRDFEGIGIGLANVNRIVSRQGGKCWAEGEVGKGAKFYFSLPVKKL
jgi:PAS domain S-box-containing protein